MVQGVLAYERSMLLRPSLVGHTVVVSLSHSFVLCIDISPETYPHIAEDLSPML